MVTFGTATVSRVGGTVRRVYSSLGGAGGYRVLCVVLATCSASPAKLNYPTMEHFDPTS